MAYAWTIDVDHLGGEDTVSGPRSISPRHESMLRAGSGARFRMYDDDGELYYSGRIVGEYIGFEPLDDYGTPNAGATEIRYLVDGTWQPL